MASSTSSNSYSALKKRRFCQHCQEYVSLRTYREHLNLYYNKSKGEWHKIESSDEEGSSEDEALNNLCCMNDESPPGRKASDDSEESHNAARSTPGIKAHR